MIPLDTLRYRHELMEDTRKGSDFERFANGFMESYGGREHVYVPDIEGGAGLTQHLHRVAQVAYPYFVTADMGRLVTAAAEQWPEDEEVVAEDFPTHVGFMLLAEPITTLDVRGRIIKVRALTWNVIENRVVVTQLAYNGDDASVGNRPAPMALSPWHLTTLRLGRELPLSVGMTEALPPEVADGILVDTSNPAAVSLYLPKGYARDELKSLAARPDPVIAWLISALRIMTQPLANPERAIIPPAAMLGFKRLKNRHVTVITYRRRAPRGDEAESTGRHYSHRFLRRGHWRRVPYKRADGTWDRRRVWIHQTVVLADRTDLPLVLREHVAALTR